MDDCIFCKIIKGEIPSYTVYEDDIIKAFLDVNPMSNGHALIIPKKHFENIYDIDSEVLTHIEMASKTVGKMLKEKLDCIGITRVQNNEYGQDVKHYHMHIIPRYDDDNLKMDSNKDKIKPVEKTFDKICK